MGNFFFCSTSVLSLQDSALIHSLFDIKKFFLIYFTSFQNHWDFTNKSFRKQLFSNRLYPIESVRSMLE